jgi:putative pyruvate formate lyase activating enzyme
VIRILRSGIHGGEEPLVWGNDRSGMIVFSGCHLACSFCYTPETSIHRLGRDFDAEGFTEILATLLASGARNINLISPSHVWGKIERVLQNFKRGAGRDITLVLKFSGYESTQLIDRFAAVADVLVPDFKVVDEMLARSVSLPPNYGVIAAKAVSRMTRTHGEMRWESSKMRHGIIVRHLLMPECDGDSVKVVETLSASGYRGYFNVMTHFVAPGKGLVKAGAGRVDRLTRLTRELGMLPMVDARVLADRLHLESTGRVSA